MDTSGIRFDKSRQFSEVRGERTVDDPHYRVAFMQGRKVGKKLVLLPFDSEGDLVKDDGKTEPFIGTNSDGKPITHQPLYNADMRALVIRLNEALADAASGKGVEEPEEIEDAPLRDMADAVDFVGWLKGTAEYPPHTVRAAYKAKYGKNAKDSREMVIDLVLDERLVQEADVCPELARYLTQLQRASA